MIPRILCIALLLSAASGRAAVYKWTDEKGAVHYSNKRPDKPPSQVKELEGGRVSEYESSGASAGGDLSLLKGGGSAASSMVEMFVTSWCPACRKAEAALRSRGIPFIEYDIEKDPSAKTRAKSLGYAGSIPFFVIGGRSRTGYSQAWVDAALSGK